MDEIMSTRPIETITAEIQQLKADAGNAIIAIGERLIEAKEQLPHGDWLPWLTEQVDFSERTARNFMRLAREWTNRQALADLGASKALTLLALPEPEREEFIEQHDVPAMSTRELEQAIRERDEARKAAEEAKTLADAMKARAETAEEKADSLTYAGNALREEIKALKAAPKEVYRDETAIKDAADAAKKAAEAEAAKKIADLEKKLAKAEKAAKDAEAKATKAGEGSGADLEAAKEEAEALRLQLEEEKIARKKDAVAADSDLAMAQEYASQVVSGANKLRGLLIKAHNAGDEGKETVVRKAILSLAEKIRGCAE